MIYQQGVYMPPGRFNTAQAILKVHFERVSVESGTKFGEIKFTVSQGHDDSFPPGLPFLVMAEAAIEAGPSQPPGPFNEVELALLQSLVSSLQ